MKVYVASSWRNNYQPGVVLTLRNDGHDVYDFKDSEGFHWSEVDQRWMSWSPGEYIKGLNHKLALRGFLRDMEALRACDALVMVMPCGPSASMEMGWAAGNGKPVAVYVPAIREPDLMVNMANRISDRLGDIQDYLKALRIPRVTGHEPRTTGDL